VRDDLGLPSRLRWIDGLSRNRFPDIAETIAADGPFTASPVVPTESEIRSVLDAAW